MDITNDIGRNIEQEETKMMVDSQPEAQSLAEEAMQVDSSQPET